ncbi:hypothetical protein WJX74_001246 [Apatococcus lobatus]|uniref:NADH dehydrogenase [ubiquinone] 1 beta subcomplex subunit 9 n=1 Tax=Apatococcus lobatus TaxID=904363 RepID=A0AAW1S2X7_9CHLO
MSSFVELKRGLQKQRAVALYRRSLKVLSDWAVHRDLFYTESEKLRTQFEANSTADLHHTERLLERGEQQLLKWKHPDPYIVAYAPGGSLFQRNPPFPPEMHQHLDFGREGH